MFLVTGYNNKTLSKCLFACVRAYVRACVRESVYAGAGACLHICK